MDNIKIIVITVCIFISNLAFAGTAEILAANSQVTIQSVTQNVDYAETDNAGVLLDTESGPVPGVGIVFSRMWSKNNTYFQAQYSFNQGYTKYVGGYLLPTPTPYGSVITTSQATITNYSSRLGMGFELGRNNLRGTTHMLTPYIELGKQKWFRGVNAGETYYHNTYGAGVLWQMSPASNKLVISINGLIGKTFDAFIDITGYFAGPLGSSSLKKAGLNFDYALNKLLHVNSGIDYTSFSYGKSAVYSGYLEPDSTSSYLFYKVGIGIGF